MSKTVIEGLTPSILWNRFYEISQIPRGSKNEFKIREYLRKFAESHNLDYKEDEVGNIVMFLPASSGLEKYPPIALQGHVDMVCEKNKDTKHDFLTDPIKLVREGDWIKADGTTLGADNGIGVAAALAIVDDNDFEHGPLELLFTVDEETGLTGANNLKPGFITAKTLLNLDTEEDGAFYIGCSGGVDTAGYYNIEFQEINKKYSPYTINVNGLKGGHSGIDIAEGRANSIKLLALLLSKLEKVDYQLVHIFGGSKRNAIPREAEAIIYLEDSNESAVRELINEFSIESSLEYKFVDPDIKVTFEKKNDSTTNYKNAFSYEFTKTFLNSLLALPHGVISMNHSIEGLVESSTNLATINYDSYEIVVGTSQRSSIESAKLNIARSVQSVFELAKAKVKSTDGYPGWQPNPDSKVLKTAKKAYYNSYMKEASIKAVHAGLECGILGDKYPGLDMISFGPTITGAHSPDEKVEINAVDKFYSFLKILLREIIIYK